MVLPAVGAATGVATGVTGGGQVKVAKDTMVAMETVGRSRAWRTFEKTAKDSANRLEEIRKFSRDIFRSSSGLEAMFAPVMTFINMIFSLISIALMPVIIEMWQIVAKIFPTLIKVAMAIGSFFGMVINFLKPVFNVIVSTLVWIGGVVSAIVGLVQAVLKFLNPFNWNQKSVAADANAAGRSFVNVGNVANTPPPGWRWD